MSTAAFVAIHGDDGFTGNSVHYDGYPAGVGKALQHMYHDTFEGDLDEMCRVLIHAATYRGGWEGLHADAAEGSEGRGTDVVPGVGTYYVDTDSYGYFTDVHSFPPWSRYDYQLDPEGLTVHGGDGSTVFVAWGNSLTAREWEVVMHLADCEGGLEFDTTDWTVNVT